MLDFDDLLLEPSDSIMVSYNITEKIKELDVNGFWVFAAKENTYIYAKDNTRQLFPSIILRIVEKNNPGIVNFNDENKLFS